MSLELVKEQTSQLCVCVCVCARVNAHVLTCVFQGAEVQTEVCRPLRLLPGRLCRGLLILLRVWVGEGSDLSLKELTLQMWCALPVPPGPSPTRHHPRTLAGPTRCEWLSRRVLQEQRGRPWGDRVV